MWKPILLVLLTVLQLLAHAAAHGCPQLCACVSSNVNCSFRSLTRVPRDGRLDHVEYWNLAHNNLSVLEHDSLQAGRTIKSSFLLDLSYNQINHLSESAFTHLKTMKHLKLDNNNITDIEFKDTSAGEVISLDLSSNPHMKLPEHGFPLRHLRLLVMERCGLTHIPSKFFAHMKNIEMIHMGENNLSVLESHTIAHLDNLVVLDLKDNQFTSLPTDLLVKTRQFVHISLAGNPFRCHCVPRYTSTSDLLLRVDASVTCSVPEDVTTWISFRRYYEEHCPLDSDPTAASLSTSPSEDTASPSGDQHSDIGTFSMVDQSKRSEYHVTSHVGWIAGVMAVVLFVVVAVYVGVRLKRSIDFHESNPQRFSILKDNDDV